MFDLLGLINYVFGGDTFLKEFVHGGNTVTANINVNFALAMVALANVAIANVALEV